MAKILIVDDVALLRRPVAMALHTAGHEPFEASSGADALVLVGLSAPDLILLDLSMPRMGGMEVLRRLRANPGTSQLPVILLTATADKEHVVEAARFGVRDYILKTGFSVSELLARVHKYVKPAPAGTKPSATPPATPAGVPTQKAKSSNNPVVAMLDKDQCLKRIELAMQGKTLSGVVANVMSMAASPRSDMAELAELIQHDSMLSARILQAANTAAYASARGAIMSIPDALRRIGCSAVRNIAAAIGIFDAMPEDTSGGFNAIRCWQHSFATARLCDDLSTALPEAEKGLAYLIGLCHDLSEILLRTEFAVEYLKVVDAHLGGMSFAQAELAVLGTSRLQVMRTIHKCLALPDLISKQIETFHSTAAGKRASHTRAMVKILHLADQTANGMLLGAGLDSTVAAFNPAECLSTSELDLFQTLDPVKWRGEILALTVMLARLKPNEAQKLAAPLVAETSLPLLIVRPAALAGADPLQMALESMSSVTTVNPPTGDIDLHEFAGIVIVNAEEKMTAEMSSFVERVLSSSRPKPVLWLGDPLEAGIPNYAQCHPLPVSLADLSGFVSKNLSGTKNIAA